MIVTKANDDKGSVAVLGRARDFCREQLLVCNGVAPERCYVCGDGTCRWGEEASNAPAASTLPAINKQRYEYILHRMDRDDNGTYEPSEGWEEFEKARSFYEDPARNETEARYRANGHTSDFDGILSDATPSQLLFTDPEPFPHEAYEASVKLDSTRGDSALPVSEVGLPDGDDMLRIAEALPDPQLTETTVDEETEDATAMHPDDGADYILQLNEEYKRGEIDAAQLLEFLNLYRRDVGLPPVYVVPLATNDAEGEAYTSELGFIDAANFSQVVKEIFANIGEEHERRELLVGLLREHFNGDLEAAERELRYERNRPEFQRLMEQYDERKKWRVGIVIGVRVQPNDRTGTGIELGFEVATGEGRFFGWSLHGVDIVSALEDAGVYDFKELDGKPCYYEPEGEGGAGTISRFKKFWNPR